MKICVLGLDCAAPEVIFGDERLAGALLDRLTHRVHILEVQGDSYRLKDSLKASEQKGGDAEIGAA